MDLLLRHLVHLGTLYSPALPELNPKHHTLCFLLQAKQVMELVGQSQSTFSDMVSELGLAAAMRPQAEYTLLVPLNVAFNGRSL